MNHYFHEERNYSDNSSQLLLTIDRSNSERKIFRQSKIYPITDDYLLSVLKEQRQSKAEIQSLKNQLAQIKIKFRKLEQRCTKNEKNNKNSEKRLKKQKILNKYPNQSQIYYYFPTKQMKGYQGSEIPIQLVTVKSKSRDINHHSHHLKTERKQKTSNNIAYEKSKRTIKNNKHKCSHYSIDSIKEMKYVEQNAKINQLNQYFEQQQLSSEQLFLKNVQEKRKRRKQIIKLSKAISQFQQNNKGRESRRTYCSKVTPQYYS